MVVAANRDESHTRPTAAADWWTDHAHILGGRDLAAGGSWLAVDRRGRLAAVTNLPSPRGETFASSRGHLVRDYLASQRSPEAFFAERAALSEPCGPYNLLIYDGERFFCSPARPLPPDIYALSNAPLGTPWPKVGFAASRLAAALEDELDEEDLAGRLFEVLENREHHGIGAAGGAPDRRTAVVFVKDERYGTRSSTVILLGRNGEVRFFERRFHADGTWAGESAHRFKAETADAPSASR